MFNREFALNRVTKLQRGHTLRGVYAANLLLAFEFILQHTTALCRSALE